MPEDMEARWCRSLEPNPPPREFAEQLRSGWEGGPFGSVRSNHLSCHSRRRPAIAQACAPGKQADCRAVVVASKAELRRTQPGARQGSRSRPFGAFGASAWMGG